MALVVIDSHAELSFCSLASPICFERLKDDVRYTDERNGESIDWPHEARAVRGRGPELPAGGRTRKPAGEVSLAKANC